MHTCRLLILTAVRPEFRAIAQALEFPKKTHNILQNKEDIALAVIGIRGVQLGRIFSEVHPQAMIMAGLAGALAPELQIGDLVYSTTAAVTGINGVRGGITTSAEIVATPTAKAALFAATGALAVDMETELAAGFAKNLAVPFLAIRAISDTAEEALDPALLKLLDSDGNPRFLRAFGHVLGHPGGVFSLLRLKRATDLALSKLAAAVADIARSDWPKSED